MNVFAAETTTSAATFETVATSAVEQVLSDLGYKVDAGKAAPFMFGQILDENKRGASSPQIIEITCAAMKVWNVYGKEREEANLYAGVCDRRLELTPETLATVELAQSRIIEVLTKSIPKENASMFAGVEPQRGILGQNLQSQYLGVVLVGHGAWILPTLIVYASDGRRALVIQSFANNCHFRPSSPMCSGQKEWLKRIALKVAQELPLN